MNEISGRKNQLIDELAIFGLSLLGLGVLFFAWVAILIVGESSLPDGIPEVLVRLIFILFVLLVLLAGFLLTPFAVFKWKKNLGYSVRILVWEIIFVFLIKVFTAF